MGFQLPVSSTKSLRGLMDPSPNQNNYDDISDKTTIPLMCIKFYNACYSSSIYPITGVKTSNQNVCNQKQKTDPFSNQIKATTKHVSRIRLLTSSHPNGTSSQPPQTSSSSHSKEHRPDKIVTSSSLCDSPSWFPELLPDHPQNPSTQATTNIYKTHQM